MFLEGWLLKLHSEMFLSRYDWTTERGGRGKQIKILLCGKDGNGKFLSQSQRERAVIPYPSWGMNKHIGRGPGKGIEIRNQEEPQDQQKNVALQEITEK